MSNGTTVRDRIRLLMAERGMSIAELGRASGVDRSTISRCLKGVREFLEHHLDCIAPVFGKTREGLVDGVAPSRARAPQGVIEADEVAKLIAERDAALRALQNEQAARALEQQRHGHVVEQYDAAIEAIGNEWDAREARWGEQVQALTSDLEATQQQLRTTQWSATWWRTLYNAEATKTEGLRSDMVGVKLVAALVTATAGVGGYYLGSRRREPLPPG